MAKLMSSSTLLVLALLVGSGFSTQYTDCGSVAGLIMQVDFSGCPDGQEICKVQQNSQQTLSIEFWSFDSSNQVKLYAPTQTGVDVCDDGMSSCPLNAGGIYTYSSPTFDIVRPASPTPFALKYELKNDNNEDIVCAEIMFEVTE